VARALNAISQVIPVVTKFFSDNAEVIKTVGKVLLAGVAVWGTYRAATLAADAAMKAYAGGGALVKKAMELVGGGIFEVIKGLRALTVFIAANPLGAIAIGVAAIAAAFVLFGDNAEVAASQAATFGESIATLRGQTTALLTSTNDLNKQISEQIEGIRSGTIGKDTVLKQIDDQIKAAKDSAILATEEIEKAKKAALESNQGGTFLSTDTVASNEELRLIQDLIKDLEFQRERVLKANREFQVSAGLNVNSLASLAKASKDVTDQLQKVEIGSNAFTRLATEAKKAADEIRKANEQVTILQNPGNSLDALNNRMQVLQAVLNRAELPGEFARAGAAVRELNEELEITKARIEAAVAPNVGTRDIGAIVPEGLTDNEAQGIATAAQGTQAFLDGLDLGKVNTFKTSMLEVKKVLIDTGQALKEMGVQAFGSLAEGIGKAVAQGKKIGDVFKQIGRELAVQAPKLLGTALLNAATTAQPWPVALALAAAGAALLGISGFAAGSFEQADLARDQQAAGALTGTGGAAGQAAQDLGTFNAGEVGRINIQIFMDSEEVSNRVRQHLNIESELQLGN
jgi:hypothetical protein